jgi:hypothetical protein
MHRIANKSETRTSQITQNNKYTCKSSGVHDYTQSRAWNSKTDWLSRSWQATESHWRAAWIAKTRWRSSFVWYKMASRAESSSAIRNWRYHWQWLRNCTEQESNKSVKQRMTNLIKLYFASVELFGFGKLRKERQKLQLFWMRSVQACLDFSHRKVQ